MKKLLLSFVLLCTTLVFLNAQDFRFGFQASPSWSWMRTDNSKINGVGTALGLKLGVVAENRFTDAYSISSGIGFHFNTGGKLRVEQRNRFWSGAYDQFDPAPSVKDTFETSSVYRYSLSFVEIPIGLKMRTPEQGNHIRWFAEPNLVLGFRSNAKGATTGLGFAGRYDQEKININSEVSFLNLSWGVGGGAEYVISNNTALVVGVYFQRGFVDMTGDSGSVTYDSANVARTDKSKGTVSSLTLRVGVMF